VPIYLWDDIDFKRLPTIKAIYAKANTANMLFAVEYDWHLSPYGVRAFGVHAGAIQTNRQRHHTKEILDEIRAKAAHTVPC